MDELQPDQKIIPLFSGDKEEKTSLPPEKIFVIGVGIFLIVAFIIYGISKAVTDDPNYQSFDFDKKPSTQNEQVAGSSAVGPYGKPASSPTQAPTEVPSSPTEASQPVPTATPTKSPDPTNTPAPTTTPTPAMTVTPTASPSATPTPTEGSEN